MYAVAEGVEKPKSMVHVFDNDVSSRDHILDGTTCWCQPEQDPVLLLVIHNEEQ